MFNDYGPFGKGTQGYITYLWAFNESQKRGGGGGSGPSGGSGCLTVFLLLVVIYLVLSALFR